MSTVLPRHTITETPPVAQALADAASVWPELADSRGALLRRLIDEGHRAVSAQLGDRIEGRRQALTQLTQLLTGVYPPGEAEARKAEWPA